MDERLSEKDFSVTIQRIFHPYFKLLAEKILFNILANTICKSPLLDSFNHLLPSEIESCFFEILSTWDIRISSNIIKHSDSRSSLNERKYPISPLELRYC